MVRRRFLSVLGGLAILLAIFLLYRVFNNQDPVVLATAITSVSPHALVSAGLFTAGSFAAISGLEYLAIRHMRAEVPLGRIVATACAAVGIGHAVGLAAFSSGAIRYRMYRRAGHNVLLVSKVLLFSGLSTVCGFAGVGGFSLVWQADRLAPVLGTTPNVMRGAGVVMLGMLACYFAGCVLSRSRALPLGARFYIRVPAAGLAALQIIGANINVFCIVGALYACLRDFTEVMYPMIATLYVGSEMTALIGHVPGGWGVLEFIATTTLSGGEILAGIVLFRAVYYLVPLFVGLLIFLIDEIIARRKQDDLAAPPITNAT